MSAIHVIPGDHSSVRLNVLLFHGLGGHHKDTWTCAGKDGAFWPSWLSEDVPGLRVALIEYDAAATRSKSSGMTIADRAANLASQITADGAYVDQPYALIGHSLGGNIIKALIRHLSDHKSANPRYLRLLSNIRLVAFLGTPNYGSIAQRKVPKFLQKLARYTPLVSELDADAPMLRDLSQWYRSNIPKSAKHIVFVEAQPMAGVMKIVSPSSSDPGLPDVIPIPVDADHISICKPSDRNSEVYRVILDQIRELLSSNLPTLLQDPSSVTGGLASRTERRRRGINSRFDSHRQSLMEAGEQRPFTILLCGPSASQGAPSAGAELCAAIGVSLSNDGFDVVYGQASGISDRRLGENENTIGRELDFIGTNCNAVIVIATEASGWSELALFGWYMASDKKVRDKGIDIVVIADQEKVDSKEFIGRGPIAYGEAVGRADIVSLSTYDPDLVLQRMRARRSMYVMDRRGRPKRTAA